MDRRQSLIPTVTLLASLAGGFSSPLLAAGPNYTFIEGRYLFDAELADVDGDGIRLGGSLRVMPKIYAFAEYDMVELDRFDLDVDLLKVGAGYIHSVNPDWDINLSLAYVDLEIDNQSDDGYELSAGVRAMIKPQIELRAHLNYIDIDGDDTYVTLGGDYFFLPNLSAGLEIDLGADDYETLSVGAKFSF